MKNNLSKIFYLFFAFSLLSVNLNANGLKDRKEWVFYLNKISRPVLQNLSNGTLKKNMPVENYVKTSKEYSGSVHYLEALGRTLCGISPWLELGGDNTKEGKLREEFIEMSTNAIKNAVDPNSPDYLNFNKYSQPLVDAAFLSQALVRAPKQLWGRLDDLTKERLINELKSTRKIKAYNNNWLLFSAMVEIAILEHSEKDFNMQPVEKALDSVKSWYLGDAWYGDGPNFHLDYYNSYVIQPMMITILESLKRHNITKYDDLYKEELKRYTIFASQLEKMISPEGSFPPIGRSITYRFGALHALSDAAYRKMLSKNVSPAQVRCGLTAVIKRQMKNKNNFDKNGWLTIGFAGHQPNMGDSYIATGSLYLCNFVFIALGLDQNDEFWSSDAQDWSQKRIWKGNDIIK